VNSQTIPEYHRAHRSSVAQWLGRSLLRLWGGWRVVGDVPAQRRLIIAVGPHTSNWDFFICLAAMLALDMRIHWLAKHSVFRPPLAGLLVRLGGIAVNRGKPEGMAADIAARLNQAEAMMIAITPEGTRKKVARLKTGFVRIARAADCPVLPLILDFQHRELRLHPLFWPTDNADQDAAAIRLLFATATAKIPANF